MEKMIDIRDEHGNSIQLTDGHGNPVVLTDEYGRLIRLTGVATKVVSTTLELLMQGGSEEGVDADGCPTSYVKTVAAAWPGGGHGNGEQEHDGGGSRARARSTTSSSSSSEEEDEQGSGRGKKKDKKKKGLTQKIREKLTGGKHKEDHSQAPRSTPAAMATKSTATVAMEQPDEHGKGAAEKNKVLKERMSGSGRHVH